MTPLFGVPNHNIFNIFQYISTNLSMFQHISWFFNINSPGSSSTGYITVCGNITICSSKQTMSRCQVDRLCGHGVTWPRENAGNLLEVELWKGKPWKKTQQFHHVQWISSEFPVKRGKTHRNFTGNRGFDGDRNMGRPLQKKYVCSCENYLIMDDLPAGCVWWPEITLPKYCTGVRSYLRLCARN